MGCCCKLFTVGFIALVGMACAFTVWNLHHNVSQYKAIFNSPPNTDQTTLSVLYSNPISNGFLGNTNCLMYVRYNTSNTQPLSSFTTSDTRTCDKFTPNTTVIGYYDLDNPQSVSLKIYDTHDKVSIGLEIAASALSIVAIVVSIALLTYHVWCRSNPQDRYTVL